MLKLAPEELVRLAPRLKSYLPTPEPTWPQVVDAAAFVSLAGNALGVADHPVLPLRSAG